MVSYRLVLVTLYHNYLQLALSKRIRILYIIFIVVQTLVQAQTSYYSPINPQSLHVVKRK